MLALAEITPHLLHQFASEADLVKAIGELSVAFTKDRGSIDRYLKDARLVSAYTAFYLTTNLPKLEGVLSWLTPEFRQEVLGYQLIDVGAGPGTFSLAWKLLGGKGEPVLWESSPLMREQAQRLLQGLTSTTAKFDGLGAGEHRLLLFGHAANEMGEAEVWRYIEKANPETVLFIEPGTPEVFQLMLKLRARFVSKQWDIAYPCLSSATCPMGGTDWCHQFLNVRHAPDVERLTQLAHKDRRTLPIITHIYRRSPVPKPVANQARLVRTFPGTKFSFEWEVCRPVGSELFIESFQLLHKEFSKAEAKVVERLRAGHLVSWESSKTVGQSRRISGFKLNNPGE
jgi:hypothetical protein